jgi:ubiquinone/menaquinone biosynthesis C-methylase UbiE
MKDSYKKLIIDHHERHIAELLVTENRKIELIDSLKRKGIGLDIGCGTGLYLHEKLIGIDISPKLIEIAKTHGDAKLMDAENLEFDDGCFDYAVCLSTLYYIEDQKKVFAEVYRVLKKGGEFHFDINNITHPRGIYWLLRYRKLPQFFLTRRKLIAMLDKFSHIDITQRGEKMIVIAIK